MKRQSLLKLALLQMALAAPLALLAQDQAQDPAPAAPPVQSSDPAHAWRKFGESSPSGAQQRNVAPAYQASAPAGALTMPAGTWISVRINEPLSSNHSQAGDAFTATLAQPLVVNGYVVARRGQTIQGRVDEAQKAGRVKGTSSLGLELTTLTLVDGQQVAVKTQLMDRRGDTSKGRDAGAIAATTGAGAAIGAAAAGGFGAGMGAIGGAVVSTIGVLATRGHATEVYPEMPLMFRLEAPVAISTERSEQAFQPATQADYESAGLQQRPAYRRPPYSGYYGGGYYAPYYYEPSLFLYSRPYFYGGFGRGYGRGFGRGFRGRRW